MEKMLDFQIDEWLTGIQNEIFFWKTYMEKRGGVRYKKGFTDTVEKNKRFLLEDEIPACDADKEICFIDVGSGPFSRCGFVTDKAKLKCIAVDPLADIYKILKKENNLENGINLESGFVELLDRKYSENSFDIVHMSNALDHSFNPVIGIAQLLYICKIGGKVILRHNENEAEAECYEGFHQWNLSGQNKEGSFIIWRQGEKYDVCELFQDYADITCKRDALEEQFHRIVLVKKKNISIPQNDIYDYMLSKVYSFLLKTIYEDVCTSNLRIKIYMKKIKREVVKLIKKKE